MYGVYSSFHVLAVVFYWFGQESQSRDAALSVSLRAVHVGRSDGRAHTHVERVQQEEAVLPRLHI